MVAVVVDVVVGLDANGIAITKRSVRRRDTDDDDDNDDSLVQLLVQQHQHQQYGQSTILTRTGASAVPNNTSMMQMVPRFIAFSMIQLLLLSLLLSLFWFVEPISCFQQSSGLRTVVLPLLVQGRQRQLHQFTSQAAPMLVDRRFFDTPAVLVHKNMETSILVLGPTRCRSSSTRRFMISTSSSVTTSSNFKQQESYNPSSSSSSTSKSSTRSTTPPAATAAAIPVAPGAPSPNLRSSTSTSNTSNRIPWSSSATSTRSSSANSVTSTTTVGTVGRWEEIHGNFVLRPSSSSGAGKNGISSDGDDGSQPRALIHFLGGALVGASPHLAYRYLLERLANEGYLIVATPYQLSFDHLHTCDTIIGRFERIATDLARTYGALPVIGVGHSLGALLQLLISSLFPDTPRAANALLSFNNKSVQDAVPLFEEFFVPFFTYVAARNDTNRHSGTEIIQVGLQLAQQASAGKVPTDELLSQALQLLVPPALSASSGKSLLIQVPQSLREAFTTLAMPSTSAMTQLGFTPTLVEALGALQQIPSLIDEVADGARDFIPPPSMVSAAAQRAYRARRTLIVRYIDDSIDESDEVEQLLRTAGQVVSMKRPMMVQIEIEKINIPGDHTSPLRAPPLDLVQRAEDLLGIEIAKERLGYKEAALTVQELVRWLAESNL